MNKIALVTGATAGIGAACAEILAHNGYNLIITGRRKDRLEELENKLSSDKTQIKALCFDIRNLKEVENAVDSLPDSWKSIDLLINNAGLAVGLNFFHEGVIDDWERMIDTNIKGLLYITRKVSPFMVEKKSGHIINIGSIAGKEAYLKGNVYCGTKHAVDAISKGMRMDLLEYNIKVTAIHPGMVDTEFSVVRFKGDKETADKVYENLTPLYATDIAEAVLFAVSRPKHVNINDMVIMPTCQASAALVNRK